MQTIQPILLGLGMTLAVPGPARPAPLVHAAELDLAHLREVLYDRQDPRGQSQAALLLVQSRDPAAEKLVRQGLRQPEEAEVFLALAAAVRLRQDGRFLDELLAALTANHPRVRQAVAETLAVLPTPGLVSRLQGVAGDDEADLAVRQTALWVLGRCGRKQAAEALVRRLAADNEDLRRVAAAALADLTGQNYGTDVARWRDWWARHKHRSAEQWLEMRLVYQTSRAQRLEGDLSRARAQVLRLQQQLYNRLPVSERLSYIRSLLEQDDPAVRVLAVVWSLELLPTADAGRQRELAAVLLRLSRDGNLEVQRAAVLGLGRLADPAAGERLRRLLANGPSSVRAAAVRALALQARGGALGSRARHKEVVAVLQKALEDSAVVVVVEAAEALGTLGAPEACPVLIGLLRHRDDHVRQTAAQALERVADARVLDDLLERLDDQSVTVRFSLVGALGRAVASGGSQAATGGQPAVKGATEEQRKRLLERLEELLRRDPDAGVRSRAATVLGECAAPALLETLWRAVQSSTEGRVQEKAWDAFVEIIARSGNLALVQRWDRTIAASARTESGAKHAARRLHLLAQVAARWQQNPETRSAAGAVREALVAAQLDQGKWSAAAPLVRDLLAGAGTDVERERRLRWLLRVGELALEEGNHTEALRAAAEAQPHLTHGSKLAEAFDKLEKEAGHKDN
jgi:HEAT repeat protein